jgi:hypothetical protein
MKLPVSLIIPFHDSSHESLDIFLQSLMSWTKLPSEILLIDSSLVKTEIRQDFQIFCHQNHCSLSHNFISREILYPGHARNVGIIKANFEYLAFLDVLTIADQIWLENSFKQLQASNTLGLWGMTFYEAFSPKEEIIRAATFGSDAIRTLPGSLMHKDIFKRCGYFLEHVRAGEDADWIKRVELHQINLEKSNQVVSYSGLLGFTYKSVLKKWFRNYRSASDLPYISRHKDLYFYSISLGLIVLAYNWNWFWLDWQSTEQFYLPNITKISALAVLIFYIFMRGGLLPMRKGVRWRFLLPFNIFRVSALSASIDLIKLSAFVSSKFNK